MNARAKFSLFDTSPEASEARANAVGEVLESASELVECQHVIVELPTQSGMLRVVEAGPNVPPLWCAHCGAMRVDGQWRSPVKLRGLREAINAATETL